MEDILGLSGFININKPSGMSSAYAVSKVKRMAHVPCGHIGTLDPLASGVLPVAVGNAARLFNYFLDKDKVYRAVFRFGVETDTLDITGTFLREKLPVPSEEEVREALSCFIGEIDQIPPAFSAKSVGGVRAYKLARQGKEVVLSSKRVRIDNISLEGREGDCFEFCICCGGGTYIRSLARDIAEKCGTSAIMTSLVREKSGPFILDNSVTPEILADAKLEDFLIPTDSVFQMPTLYFVGDQAKKLSNGIALPFDGKAGEYKLYFDGNFYGIACVTGGTVRTKVKLV